MIAHGMRIADIYRIMAVNQEDMTDLKGFKWSMAKIGYREEKSDFFADVFRAIDADGSGVLQHS